MNWYMLRTSGSSAVVSGLVKISKRNCSDCDSPIITLTPTAKISCRFANLDPFDVDFCLINSAIAFKSEFLPNVRDWCNQSTYIQPWKGKTEADFMDGYVLSIDSLPAIDLEDGVGTTRLRSCNSCYPYGAPNILYDYSVGPTVRGNQLNGFDLMRIRGMHEVLISQKAYDFVSSHKLGSVSATFLSVKQI